MAQDHTTDASGPSAQGIFIGWLAIGLLSLMGVFTLLLLIAGLSG